MSKPQRLRVNEIFYSVQGEGTRAGVRCVFIRLTGCHLRCTYCDTAYAFYEGEWMTLDEILERVRGYKCLTVEVTGGEPLLQPKVYPLMERLADEFETVLLETSGAVSVAKVDPRVVRIVDFKCPSSGEVERNDWDNVNLLRPIDEVKFVIGTRADYEWARDVIREYDLPSRCPVLFAPVTGHPGAGSLTLAKGQLEPVRLAEWLLEDGLDVRLGLQLHKIIWPTRARGV
ncbi:MAG: radical SAM protein [Phycisphaerae bacterium]